MSGDNTKWYDLRSSTNARTRYEQARRPNNPLRTSDYSSYIAAESVPQGNSTLYTSQTNQTRYSATVSPTQFSGPANPASNSGAALQSLHASVVNSNTSATPTVLATNVDYEHPSSYVSTATVARYTSSGDSRLSQYPAPEKSMPNSSSTLSLPYCRPPVPPRSVFAVQKQSSDKTPDQSLDDLINQLSDTRIDEPLSAQDSRPAPVPAPPYQDPIVNVVQDVLTQDLRWLGNEKLLPSDPVFNLARKFAKKWNISDDAVNSHISLACGFFKFPVLLLLNPAPTHEFLPFDQMVKECKTLRWIEDVLFKIHLGLGDVIILDACTLLSNDRIRMLEKESKKKKEQAMAEAYDLTQEMLKHIQPNIILSCQCSTSFSRWSAGGHAIAWQLCSSIKTAKDRQVKKVYLNNRTINVIHGYHPSGFLNNRGGSKLHHDTFGDLLKSVFRTVYSPCATWKSQYLLDSLPSSK